MDVCRGRCGAYAVKKSAAGSRYEAGQARCGVRIDRRGARPRPKSRRAGLAGQSCNRCRCDMRRGPKGGR